MVTQLGIALAFIEHRRHWLLEDAVRPFPVTAASVPQDREGNPMFGEGHHDSIIQPGIDDALACRDMLQPAPARPSPFTRLIARLVAAMRAIAHRDPADERPATAAASHVTR